MKIMTVRTRANLLCVSTSILLLLFKCRFCWSMSLSQHPSKSAISSHDCTFPSSMPLMKEKTSPSSLLPSCRRQFLVSTSFITIGSYFFGATTTAFARVPGSKDAAEAVQQIEGAFDDLRKLRDNWGSYATIDAEGRAGSTDAARRILGGIAPQSGRAAIEVANATPLYRIDGAFSAIRQAAIEETIDWASNLDLVRFEELVERILFAIQKADGDFYSVLFAAKGTRMVSGIFGEAKAQVNQGIADFEELIGLLKDAGAPLS